MYNTYIITNVCVESMYIITRFILEPMLYEIISPATSLKPLRGKLNYYNGTQTPRRVGVNTSMFVFYSINDGECCSLCVIIKATKYEILFFFLDDFLLNRS